MRRFHLQFRWTQVNRPAADLGCFREDPWNNTHFIPMAWRGYADLGMPLEKGTDGSGYADFWAPSRGYAVYAPD